MNRTRIVRVVTTAGRAVRDGWLLIGATLVVILLMEAAYRTQLMFRYGSLSPQTAAEPPSPFEATPWAKDYWIGHELEEAVQWSPYVYVRNPAFSAPHAAVGADGYRVTPIDAPPGATNTLTVFFLGGSTTFGWYQRTAHTFPAAAARRIQALVGPHTRLKVTNFGAPGRTVTQELFDLILALRRGERPDLVVFYDGINDVMATVQNGEAGLPQNEWNRVADFDRGRAIRSRPGLVGDLRALTAAAGAALSRARFVERLTRRAPADPPTADALARALVATYVETARVVEALAADYGFVPVYVWQPALLSTTKPLTAREAWLAEQDDAFVDTVRAVHRAVPPLLGEAMAPLAAERFVDATHVFAADRGEIFVDLFGHTYERANPFVVAKMTPALEVALTKALAPAED